MQTRLLNSFAVCVIALSFAHSALAQNCDRTMEVMVREDVEDDWELKTQRLTNLKCNGTFEGEYFKIVKGDTDEVVSISEKDEKIRLKAANVYFHLTKARNFWINTIRSRYVNELKQIVVRLDITNAFSNVRHFKHKDLEENYNNAWTIPEGSTPKGVPGEHSWGKEIWFSPMMKKENRKNYKSVGNNPLHQGFKTVQEPVIQYNKNALIYSGLALTISNNVNTTQVLVDTAWRVGAVVTIAGFTWATKFMDKLFMEKWFWIDTAMIPEIIYHEYAHVAMSDTMKPVHSVPVIEGMADYFATVISGSEKMYKKMKPYSSNQYKNTLSKEPYSPYLEGDWNATSDFTLSLLWQGRMKFDEMNQARIKAGRKPVANYDEMVFEMHLTLNESSDIQNGLLRALTDACHSKCTDKMGGTSALLQLFEKRGLN